VLLFMYSIHFDMYNNTVLLFMYSIHFDMYINTVLLFMYSIHFDMYINTVLLFMYSIHFDMYINTVLLFMYSKCHTSTYTMFIEHCYTHYRKGTTPCNVTVLCLHFNQPVYTLEVHLHSITTYV